MNIPVNIHREVYAAETVLPDWSSLTRILVVGNDAAILEENRELLQSLGYACTTASDALSALQLIASDNTIGIVLTSLKMEKLDGLFLLNEIAERFMALRPIVTIALGEAASDLNIEVMRSGASDLLVTPLTADNLSSGLRRATALWTRLTHQFRTSLLNGVGQESIVRSAPRTLPANRDPSFADLCDLGVKLIKARENRANYVGHDLLNEATWGILLDLTVAGLKGERVATSSACAAAQVPLSTALRHVNQLIKAGWIRRTGDPRDRRRTFLELQPRLFDVMTDYLRSIWSVFGANPGGSARNG